MPEFFCIGMAGKSEQGQGAALAFGFAPIAGMITCFDPRQFLDKTLFAFLQQPNMVWK